MRRRVLLPLPRSLGRREHNVAVGDATVVALEINRARRTFVAVDGATRNAGNLLVVDESPLLHLPTGSLDGIIKRPAADVVAIEQPDGFSPFIVPARFEGGRAFTTPSPVHPVRTLRHAAQKAAIQFPDKHQVILAALLLFGRPKRQFTSINRRER